MIRCTTDSDSTNSCKKIVVGYVDKQFLQPYNLKRKGRGHGIDR